MSLRSRLIGLFTLVLALLAGALIAGGVVYQRLTLAHQIEVTSKGQAALWRRLVEDEVDRLAALLPGVVENPELIDAVAAQDPGAINRVAGPLAARALAAGTLTDLQILDPDGDPLFAASVTPEPPRVLDAGSIDAVLGGTRASGLRQVSADRVAIAVAEPILTDRPVGTVTLATSAAGALSRYGALVGAAAFLLSARGRMVHGTAPELWRAAGARVPARRNSLTVAAIGDRLYSVSGVPLTDLMRSSGGILVSLRDGTEALHAASRIATLSLAGGLGLALASLVALYLMIGRSFRPLEGAIAALQAMARGERAVPLPAAAAARDDEIGRIAGAVRAYRSVVEAVGEERRQRELQRRRQERFIRNEMATLAASLDDEARRQVLAGLKRAEAAHGRGHGQTHDGPDGQSGGADGDDQLGLLATVLGQLSTRIVTQHRLLKEMIERLREALVRETKLAGLEKELALARKLQRDILPADQHHDPRFQVQCRMEPAKEVGGDFFDHFTLPGGRFGVVVADVSGKSVPAAFYMAICRTLVRSLAANYADLGACFTEVNRWLSEHNPDQFFVTAFYGAYDPSTAVLHYINAGHNPPALIRDGAASLIEITGDLALGLLDDFEYREHAMTLQPGDCLVLYTDGVTEAANPREEMFEDERLLAFLTEAAAAALPPDQMVARLFEALEAFANGAEQADDITYLSLTITNGADDARTTA